MNYFTAALSGLAIGLLGAFANYKITLAALEKGTTRALSLSNLIHTVVNIAVLALIFLMRNVLPFDFMVCIVAAAVGLSMGSIIFSFKAAKRAKLSAPEQQPGEVTEDADVAVEDAEAEENKETGENAD